MFVKKTLLILFPLFPKDFRLGLSNAYALGLSSHDRFFGVRDNDLNVIISKIPVLLNGEFLLAEVQVPHRPDYSEVNCILKFVWDHPAEKIQRVLTILKTQVEARDLLLQSPLLTPRAYDKSS